MGAMDTAMTMDRDGSPSRVALKVTKQKDHDEGSPMFFNRLIVRPEGWDEGSIVLIPAPSLDERFTAEGMAMEAAIKRLLGDPTFESDRARARELSRLFPNLTETASQTRVSKARRSMEAADDPNPSIH